MDEFARDLREERRRRVMYIIFALGMTTSVIICAVLLYSMTKQTPKLVRLGPVERFNVNQPLDVAVKQLETSKLMPTHSDLSEDVIYVIKQTDGQYRALLGLDPSNGCFLSWHEDQRRYSAGCTPNTYDVNGINQTEAATSTTRPINMVELPTQVTNNTLFLEDRIQRRDLQ